MDMLVEAVRDGTLPLVEQALAGKAAALLNK